MRQVALNTHISGRFNIELENLRNSVMAMGGEVEQQLADTLKAIATNNPGRVIQGQGMRNRSEGGRGVLRKKSTFTRGRR